MYNLQVMYELNALPLAYQITGLCGNVMVSRLNIMDYLQYASEPQKIFFRESFVTTKFVESNLYDRDLHHKKVNIHVADIFRSN